MQRFPHRLTVSVVKSSCRKRKPRSSGGRELRGSCRRRWSAGDAAAARDFGRHLRIDLDYAVLGLADAVLGRHGNIVLALGNDVDAIGGNAGGDECRPYRLDPLLRELLIIGVGAAAVGK